MRRIIFILLIFSVGLSLSAELNRLRIVGQAEPRPNAIVRGEYQTVNRERAACLIFVTDLDVDLDFRPRVELVALTNPAPGQHHVYVAPDERVVTVHALGYAPLTVVLRDFGISVLRSGEVYELQLTGDEPRRRDDVDLFTVHFDIQPDDVYISHNDNTPVPVSGNRAQFRVPAGRNVFTFIKSGYREETVSLDIDSNINRTISLSEGTAATELKLPGFVNIDSSPRGAEVYINEQLVGNTPYVGRLIAGDYAYSLSYPLYHTLEGSFSLEEGENLSLPAAELTPRFGTVKIDSQPQGAAVYIDNQRRGETPLPALNLESRSYELELRLDLYHTNQQRFIVSDGAEKQLDIEMQPAFGSLTVNSHPEQGADVYIDNVRVGQTPYTNDRQPSGRFLLRVEKELWSAAPRQIEVEDGAVVEETFNLSANFGTLTVVTDDADIYVDDEKVAKGRYEGRLAQGRYTVTAKKDLHTDAETDVFIQTGRTETLQLDPVPRTGVLTVESSPYETLGAEIWLDGEKQSQTTPAAMRLLIGSYDLRIRKEGFGDATRNVTIRENQETEVKVTMSRKMPVTITSVPSGADIYFDGKRLGRTPARIDLPIGNNRITLNRDDYLEHSENINVSQTRDEFSFIMRVDPETQAGKERFIQYLYEPDGRSRTGELLMPNASLFGLLTNNEYHSIINLFYFQGLPMISLPGLIHVNYLFNDIDYQPSYNTFTFGAGLFGEVLLGADGKESFWGINYFSLNMGYLFAFNYHKTRIHWNNEFGFKTLYLSESYSYDRLGERNNSKLLHTPIKTELNLEIFTGRESFFVLTTGIHYAHFGQLFHGYSDLLTTPSHFKEGWQPYFGAGLRF